MVLYTSTMFASTMSTISHPCRKAAVVCYGSLSVSCMHGGNSSAPSVLHAAALYTRSMKGIQTREPEAISRSVVGGLLGRYLRGQDVRYQYHYSIMKNRCRFPPRAQATWSRSFPNHHRDLRKHESVSVPKCICNLRPNSAASFTTWGGDMVDFKYI